MNKKFVILISTATTLLVVLIVILSVFRSSIQSTEQEPAQVTMPTSIPDASRGNGIPFIVKENLNAPDNFQDAFPFNSDALSLDYSPISKKIYIEKKNEKADEELKKFLESYDLLKTYEENPELFKITSLNIDEQINIDEQGLSEPDLIADEQSLSPTPTPNPNDPTSDVRPVLNVFKTLMGYNTTLTSLATSTSTTPSIIPAGVTNIPGVAQLGSFKMRVKWDFGESNLRLCKVHQFTLAIVAYLQKRFGSSASYGIGKDCKTGTGKVFAHQAGRGVDYTFRVKYPDRLLRGNAVFAWLITNAQNIGIQYVKYWRLQWSGQGGITCVPDPLEVVRHSNHIHFELNLAAAQKQTPFFTRNQSVNATTTINQEICPLLDPRMK